MHGRSDLATRREHGVIQVWRELDDLVIASQLIDRLEQAGHAIPAASLLSRREPGEGATGEKATDAMMAQCLSHLRFPSPWSTSFASSYAVSAR